MYIAHNCPNCDNHIVLHLSQQTQNCDHCSYVETIDQFWEYCRQERYLNDLENEIEERFPFKSIDSIKSSIYLAIGAHVLGKIEMRDSNMKSMENKLKNLYEKWNICYCDFSSINKKVKDYESRGSSDETKKYEKNLESLKPFFDELPSYIKYLYKHF